MPVFSAAENGTRVAAVKQSMSKRGIEVQLCSHPANMNYLSGYDGWSYCVHQLVIVALSRQRPVWVGRDMDLPGAQATVWMSDDDLRGYPDDYVDNPDKHPMGFVARVLAELGEERATIGVEMDAWYFTAAAYVSLQTALPNASFVDAWPMINWVRLIKSDAEVGLMRGAAEIVAKAMQRAIDTIEPGVRENDAVAEITQAQISGTDKYWGDYPATLAAVPSGARSAAPHLTWSGEPFGDDSMTNIELGGCHHRYHAALARTLCLGTVPDELERVAAVTGDGLDEVLAVLRPGVSCEQVEAVWAAVIRAAGYEKSSRIGYSIGLNYPPDWGEQSASLRPGDTTQLAPNMCFHIMLGMWMDGWGYELSETVRVTKSGVEVLTQFPRQLFVKP